MPDEEKKRREENKCGKDGRYDIIDLPHPVSKKHPQMSRLDRAAQFAPFAALTGFDDDIGESERLTCRRAELDPGQIMILNDRLSLIMSGELGDQTVRLTYFVPDGKKAGGAYVTKTGVLKRFDEINREIIMSDKSKIPIDDLYGVESGSPEDGE